MHPMLNIAIRAIRKPCNFIMKNYYNFNNLSESLSNNFSYVNNINHKIEQIIIQTIQDVYPQHNITKKLQMRLKDNSVNWIIGSIEEVINFVNCFPYFSISIAVVINKRTEIVVIYDILRNELFTAVRGQGAKLGNYRIRVKNLYRYNNIICTNLFFKKSKIDIIDSIFRERDIMKYFNFRYIGSTILDFAYLASGRIHGIFSTGLKLHDLIIGELIIRESGCLITDFFGHENYVSSGNVVAGNPKLIRNILSYIRKSNKN